MFNDTCANACCSIYYIPCLKEGYGCTPFTIWHRQKRTFQFHSIYHWTWSNSLIYRANFPLFDTLIWYTPIEPFFQTPSIVYGFFLLYPPQKGNKRKPAQPPACDALLISMQVGILPIFTRGINLARRGVFYEACPLCVGWFRGVKVSVSVGDSLTETGCCHKSTGSHMHAGGMITEITLVTKHKLQFLEVRRI